MKKRTVSVRASTLDTDAADDASPAGRSSIGFADGIGPHSGPHSGSRDSFD